MYTKYIAARGNLGYVCDPGASGMLLNDSPTPCESKVLTKENGIGTQSGLDVISRTGRSSYMTISLVDISDMSVLLVA